MRAVIPMLCLLLFGCGSRVTHEQVTDPTGSNQLLRVDRKVGSILDLIQSRQSFDFDSLVWRTNAGGIWYDHVVISQAAFQGGSPRRRWVSEIHSLDGNGTAIIKVAEGNVTEGSPNIRYIYTWREWNLLTNGELRVLRVCADPFEKYQP